ncbi:MAG: EamA family transporter, partial [Gammaproteobacteria bacterium]|nr:EamA family transporter [Gammaproteobacteria bacterium]
AVLASVAWMGAISKFELSYAYPFMSLNFVVVVLLSFFLFQEVFNWYKIIGLVVICLGIIIISKGS